MKILFIQNSMDSGGISRVNAILARELIARKCEVEFLSYKTSNESEFVTYSFNFSRYKIYELVLSFFKLLYFLKGRDYDLVISSSDLISLPVCLVNRFYRKKLIVNSHTNVLEHLKSASIFKKILYKFCGFSYRYSSIVANVSKGAVLASKEFYNNKKIIELPNPVECWNENDKVHLAQPWFINKRVIIACGRLTQSKNYPLMLQVMKVVVSKYDDVRLLILGDGELYDSLKNQIKNMGLESYVCLQGKVSNPMDYMAKSEFLLHTSFYEGSPAVLLEAMSAGIPAVTTNFKSGADEIIGKNKYGIIANSFEISDVANSVMEMLNYKRLPKSYYQQSVKKYSPSRCCSYYLESVGLEL